MMQNSPAVRWGGRGQLYAFEALQPCQPCGKASSVRKLSGHTRGGLEVCLGTGSARMNGGRPQASSGEQLSPCPARVGTVRKLTRIEHLLRPGRVHGMLAKVVCEELGARLAAPEAAHVQEAEQQASQSALQARQLHLHGNMRRAAMQTFGSLQGPGDSSQPCLSGSRL